MSDVSRPRSNEAAPSSKRRFLRTISIFVAVAIATTACSSSSTDSEGVTSNGSTASPASAATTGTVFDAAAVHDISVEFDDAEYASMLAEYQSSGDKGWIEATVTIDGQTFSDVGLRLKGNSSLRSASADADPTDLPWLIRLDKFVDGQQLDGYTDLVVRSSSSEAALEEAVALDLLEQAGLASEHAVATSFTVNGGEPTLRLVVQALDETWESQTFQSAGLLYKAEASGDYTYRGEDAAAYEDVFDQETGAEDLTPLIEFLDFINNASDEEFAANLGEHLDVEEFARYLAFEDLIDNFDDIAGPGNNSYLRYDYESGQFTVVAWDHNLAFGVRPTGGGAGGTPGGALPGDGELPTDLPTGGPPAGGALPGGGALPTDLPDLPTGGPPAGGAGAGGGVRGGSGGQSNVLVERFNADAGFKQLYDDALAELSTQLYDSGDAEATLSTWAELLTTKASDLIDVQTVQTEAEAIQATIARMQEQS